MIYANKVRLRAIEREDLPRFVGWINDPMCSLLHHAFESLNPNRISLQVFESNPRAIKVDKRVGFTVEGRLREARFSQGRYEDAIIMSILRDEWRTKSEGEE